MAGHKETSVKLNKTLLFIINLLNNNDIKDWFICYGTLLGLVRENSCIDNDDDIDIIIDKQHFHLIKKLLLENKFTLYSGVINSTDILKTNDTSEYASIDIYMGDFNNEDVFDRWNKLNIKDCFLDKINKTFIIKEWNGVNLYYPNNYERILINRYGNDWNIKQDKKIPQTMTVL